MLSVMVRKPAAVWLASERLGWEKIHERMLVCTYVWIDSLHVYDSLIQMCITLLDISEKMQNTSSN